MDRCEVVSEKKAGTQSVKKSVPGDTALGMAWILERIWDSGLIGYSI